MTPVSVLESVGESATAWPGFAASATSAEPRTKHRAGTIRAGPLSDLLNASRRGLLADGDLLRLRFRALRQSHRQHAVLVGRADAARIDRGRQCERTAERSQEPLHPLESIARDLRADFRSPLSVSTLFSNVTPMSSRFMSGSSALMTSSCSLGLVNINRRHPAARQAFAIEIREHVVEPIDLHRSQLPKWIPTNECHC